MIAHIFQETIMLLFRYIEKKFEQREKKKGTSASQTFYCQCSNVTAVCCSSLAGSRVFFTHKHVDDILASTLACPSFSLTFPKNLFSVIIILRAV